MDNPFYYGEEVGEPYFADRRAEVKDLTGDLSRGQNVILLSPRRYGKTSLIKMVLSILNDRGLSTFYINLYAATSKRKFIDIYARAVASGTKGKLDQIIQHLKDLFPRMLPKIIIKGEGIPEFEFEYNRESQNLTLLLEDLYGAVEKYANKRGKKAVVVFDEFQEILNMEDDEVERTMRGAIQSHKKTAYVFVGSRRNLMQKLFNDIGRPFYKSGRMFPLGKIGLQDFLSFISDKFGQGNISADPAVMEEILSVSECHPYYTQMLCSVLWDRNSGSGRITSRSISQAVDELISRESYVYTTIWDGLTLKRRSLLEALVTKGGKQLYSKDLLSGFDIGSASQVQKAVKYFEEKGILYRENGMILFADMFFKKWISRRIAL